MCTYLIQKFNESVILFLLLENIISYGHVDKFQNLNWKNLAIDPKEGSPLLNYNN